jgi:hypothetical protein
MAKQQSSGRELDLRDDIRFHQRQWTFERAGWAALALLLLLAFAGVFGAGPLSHAGVASHDQQLTVEYDRFARRQAPSSLTLRFSPQAVQQGKLRFWLARDYVESLGVQHVEPEPAATQVSAGRIVYEFDVYEMNAAPGGDLEVTFELEPEHAARLQGSAGLEGGAAVSFWQLIYP